jgi:uncharacterized protein YpuA (DUF1002 family)
LKEKIKEIEDIVTKMEKEGETIEDYQRIIELTQKIKELFEEKERDFEAEVKTIVANLEKALKKELTRTLLPWVWLEWALKKQWN